MANTLTLQGNKNNILKAVNILIASMALGNIGIYQIQAAISAVHSQAQNYISTDWLEITLLYNKLYQLQANPVISLNSAVAQAMLHGPLYGLKLIEDILHNSRMENYQPLYAAKADLQKTSRIINKSRH